MSSYETSRPSKKEKIIKEMGEEDKKPLGRVQVDLDPQLKTEFHSIAIIKRSSMKSIIHDFIEKYVEEWKKKNEKS